jgi:hypothetical protein
MIPNSQLTPDYNEFKPNLKLPDWFSDKLITDFFKYEEESEEQHWIEKGLAVNETALALYESEIKPLLHTKMHHETVENYKMLAGNVFNFETIFRDNNWNYEMDENFQFKHQIIIAKYREIYNSNLKKWQDSLASLNEIISKKK